MSQLMARRATGHVSLRRGKRRATWYVKYRLPNGHQIQRRLGPAWEGGGRPPTGYFTKRIAEDALRGILVDTERGEIVHSVRTGRTFKDACDEWLRYVEFDNERSPSTLRDYRNTVRRHLIPAFGADTRIEAIDKEAVSAFRRRLLDAGSLSRPSIQKVMVLLHGLFKRAKRNGWIAVNPCEDVERITVKRSGDFNVLTPIEVEAVARNASSERDAALFRVAAYTGLRMGELRALRWRDVDFATRTVHVRRNLPHGCTEERSPKSGVVRSVPLIDQAATALEALSRRGELTAGDDLVFGNDRGGHLDDGLIRHAFYAAMERAGLGDRRTGPRPFRFHDLRHTFGTTAVQVWPVTDVQFYMGHADIKTTMQYVHHVPKHDAAGQLSQLVAETTGILSPSLSRKRESTAQLAARMRATARPTAGVR